MINNKKVLAVIPARSGSKGIPQKNIFPILDKPLIEYTIEETKKSKYIDKITVSTDDRKIKKITENLGIKVPFLRPKELASDFSPSEDTILHAIKYYEDNNNIFDIFILLQPTSPLRKKEHIDHAIYQYANSTESTSLISVTKVKQYPQWMKIKADDGSLKSFLNIKNHNIRRQDLPELFFPNGAIYLSDIKHFKKYKSFNKGYILPFFMHEEESFDVDNYLDIRIIEMILKKN